MKHKRIRRMVGIRKAEQPEKEESEERSEAS